MKSKNANSNVDSLYGELYEDLKNVLVDGVISLKTSQDDVYLSLSYSGTTEQVSLEYIPTESEYKLIKVSIGSDCLPRKTLEVVMPLPELIEDGLKPIIEGTSSSLMNLIVQYKNIFWSEYPWAQDSTTITSHLLRENLFPKEKMDEVFAYKLFTQKFLEQTFKNEFGTCEIDHLWYEINSKGSILCTFVNSSKVAFTFKQTSKQKSSNGDVTLELITGIDTATIVCKELGFLTSGLSKDIDVNKLIDFRPFLKIK